METSRYQSRQDLAEIAVLQVMAAKRRDVKSPLTQSDSVEYVESCYSGDV
jgi:hypothetical protein